MKLEDFEGGFPAEFYFFDIKEQTLKKIIIPKEAWHNTLKTFEDNDNVSHGVIFKYMSKHDTVKTQEV